MLPGLMDLRDTGAPERKREDAPAITKKLLTLRSFSWSPFWEDIHEQWAHVFTKGLQRSPTQLKNSSRRSKTSSPSHTRTPRTLGINETR